MVSNKIIELFGKGKPLEPEAAPPEEAPSVPSVEVEDEDGYFDDEEEEEPQDSESPPTSVSELQRRLADGAGRDSTIIQALKGSGLYTNEEIADPKWWKFYSYYLIFKNSLDPEQMTENLNAGAPSPKGIADRLMGLGKNGPDFIDDLKTKDPEMYDWFEKKASGWSPQELSSLTTRLLPALKTYLEKNNINVDDITWANIRSTVGGNAEEEPSVPGEEHLASDTTSIDDVGDLGLSTDDDEVPDPDADEVPATPDKRASAESRFQQLKAQYNKGKYREYLQIAPEGHWGAPKDVKDVKISKEGSWLAVYYDSGHELNDEYHKIRDWKEFFKVIDVKGPDDVQEQITKLITPMIREQLRGMNG